MPVNGLVSDRDELEFKVRSEIGTNTQTGIGDGSYAHGANAETYYVLDVLTAPVGISLQVGGVSSSNQWSVTYTGPGAPLGVTWTGTGWTSCEAKVVVENEKLYNGVFWVLQGTLKVYDNDGVLQITATLEETSSGMGPGYVPLWGIPIKMTGSCSAITVNLPSPMPSTWDYTAEASATATGGWRYKEAGSGTWVALPVTLAPGAPPAIPGGCTDPSYATVSATNTYDLTIESYSKNRNARSVHSTGSITECCIDIYCDGVLTATYCQTQTPAVPWTVYEDTTEGWARSGEIWGVPDLDKSFERFQASDFAAIWYRTEMPQTQYSATSSCTINGVTSSSGGATEVHPYQDEIADNVIGAGPAAMEDTLGYNSYDPWAASGSYSKEIDYVVDSGNVACPDVPAGTCAEGQTETVVTRLVGGWTLPATYSQSATRQYTFPSSVGTEMVAHQSHDWLIARYWGSWCNPHWSYGYYRDDWEVDGVAAPWAGYWGSIGAQWPGDTFIDIARRTKRRNHIYSCALEDGGMVPWQDTFFSGLRWIGVSRWQTDAVTPAAYVDMDADSAPAWTTLSASTALTFGADIEITNTGAVDIARFIFRVDLGRFTEKPYLWPLITKSVLLGWTLTNIDQVKVYAESRSGRRLLFEQTPGDGFTTEGVQYDMPREADLIYAGSWAQDFGNGVVADQGVDLLPTGVSAGTVGDPEYQTGFELHPFGQPAWLRFEITPTDSFTPVNIDYPRLYRSEDEYSTYLESRQVMDIVWPDGPGIRLGQWAWYQPGAGLNNPPSVLPLGYKGTIIDWLCARRVIFENLAHDDGLSTELTVLFDSFEGQSVGQVDRNSIFFILPK